MYKILIIITRSEIGGAQKYVLSIAENLSKSFQLEVISGSNGFLTDALKQQGIKVTVISSLDSFNPIYAIRALRRELVKSKPHLVNSHSTLASIYGRIAAHKLDIPVIYSVHGWYFANRRNFLRYHLGPWIEILLAPLTDYWIAETDFDKNLGIKRGAILCSDRCITIANGIKPVNNRTDLKLDREKIQIAFIGRISYQKNPSLALRVLAILPNNYHLTIYSDGVGKSKLESEAVVQCLEDRITFIEGENQTDSIIHAYDLLLVTSRYEGMPLAIIEAMAAGLPIVSTNICGISELVREGINGYLVDGESAAILANKIKSIFKNPGTHLRMSTKSRELYEKNHTERVMTAKLQKVFLSRAEFANRVFNEKDRSG